MIERLYGFLRFEEMDIDATGGPGSRHRRQRSGEKNSMEALYIYKYTYNTTTTDWLRENAIIRKT
jgi:hypothetical protein